MLDDLFAMFNPMKDDAQHDNLLLISIFENAAKNNQALPGHLLKKLEEALCKECLEQKVLSVFIYLAEG